MLTSLFQPATRLNHRRSVGVDLLHLLFKTGLRQPALTTPPALCVCVCVCVCSLPANEGEMFILEVKRPDDRGHDLSARVERSCDSDTRRRCRG